MFTLHSLSSKMGSSGMYLGSKITSQNHKHLDEFSSEHAHAQRSDLERGHRIPKDGQMSFTHGNNGNVRRIIKKNEEN